MDSYRYTPFSPFLSPYLDGKIQKISVHAGLTCPNRDGSIGVGGCTYCNNQTFSPDYCHSGKSISEQLTEGIAFFARKYPSMRYLAYFQAYTNTYGELQKLKSLYEEALKVDGVVGLVIGTRPDCMPDELLEYLVKLSKRTFILIEYGVESTKEETLIRINRGHTWLQAKEAINRTSAAELLIGAHFILGLPGETHEDILLHADRIATLPLNIIKLHQLQLIRKTRMAQEYQTNPEQFHLFTVDEYIDLVIDFLERIPQSIVVERFTSQSPKELLLAPDWGLKNYEFTHKLLHRMEERNSWQGKAL